MCINFNGYHSGGSSFVNINDCWLLKKLFVYHRYKSSSENNNNNNNKESQYMVSHPKTGSDSPIGSDRDRGRDKTGYATPSPSDILSCPQIHHSTVMHLKTLLKESAL